jgi:hypothetical protein
VIPNFFAWREDFTLSFQRSEESALTGSTGLWAGRERDAPGRAGREAPRTSCGSHQADAGGIRVV